MNEVELQSFLSDGLATCCKSLALLSRNHHHDTIKSVSPFFCFSNTNDYSQRSSSPTVKSPAHNNKSIQAKSLVEQNNAAAHRQCTLNLFTTHDQMPVRLMYYPSTSRTIAFRPSRQHMMDFRSRCEFRFERGLCSTDIFLTSSRNNITILQNRE